MKELKNHKELTERNSVYQKCPICKKHWLDLKLHIWGSHLDANEKQGKLRKDRDYSKILKYLPVTSKTKSK